MCLLDFVEASTIFLSPRAFEQPLVAQMADSEFMRNVMNAVRTAIGTQSLNVDLGAGSRVRLRADGDLLRDVAITAELSTLVWEHVWRYSPQAMYIARRYIATSSGLVRTLPGLPLRKVYDPLNYEWYACVLLTVLFVLCHLSSVLSCLLFSSSIHLKLNIHRVTVIEATLRDKMSTL